MLEGSDVVMVSGVKLTCLRQNHGAQKWHVCHLIYWDWSLDEKEEESREKRSDRVGRSSLLVSLGLLSLINPSALAAYPTRNF